LLYNFSFDVHEPVDIVSLFLQGHRDKEKQGILMIFVQILGLGWSKIC